MLRLFARFPFAQTMAKHFNPGQIPANLAMDRHFRKG